MSASVKALLLCALVLILSSVGCRGIGAVSGTKTPAEVADSFYRWYLGYAGNPLAEAAYRERAELSAVLVQRVDDLIASADRAMYDPFLCAQDVPADYAIDTEGDAVTLREIWNAGTDYELVHEVGVEFIQEDGAWKIANVICQQPSVTQVPTALHAAAVPTSTPIAAPPSPTTETLILATNTPIPTESSGAVQVLKGWSVFEDAKYGYALAYPAGWVGEEVEILSPELAAPVVQIWNFMPQEVAENMNPSGPPDPTQPPVVPPVAVEVSVGDMEEYRRMYPPPSRSETLSLAGYEVVREVAEISEQAALIRYIFQNPADPRIRVTVIDNISGFPARVEGSEDVVTAIQAMLSTFSFKD